MKKTYYVYNAKEQIGNNKKHKAVIKKQLRQPVFFCKILKSLSRQDIPLPRMEWVSMQPF